MVAVRPGCGDDLAQLNEIFNHYVRETPITFELEPLTMQQRRSWFEHYNTAGRHRLLVAVDGSRVVGYATSSPYKPKHDRRRHAYETSVETSVYLAPDATGRGVGTALYDALFAAIAGEDLHRAYAGITVPNAASVVLHERFGFRKVALFTQQGRKFNRYWDVAFYEKPL